MTKKCKYPYSIYAEGKEDEGELRFESKQKAEHWLKTVHVEKFKNMYFASDSDSVVLTTYSFPNRKSAKEYINRLKIERSNCEM
jgi:hypothetical protein